MRNFTFLFFFLLFFCCFSVSGQKKTVPKTPEKIFQFAEQMPEFPGGQDSLMRHIGRTIRYPQQAMLNSESGTSYITFVVDTLGRITEPQVLKSAAPSLDAEALRVVSTMPKWNPGKQNGKNVAVKFTLPIKFQFEDAVFTFLSKSEG
jgi:protein TonB